MNNNLLECKQLTKTFTVSKKKYTVLDKLDLVIKNNEIVLIQGKSGQGKSVLLWLLSGLDIPTSGEILFKDKSITRLSNKKLAQYRRENISIIFQDFNLIPSWTAMENVEAALLYTHLTKKEKRKKVIELLSKLKIENRLNNLPHELSIGERQRVAIARNLITNPKIIIADEPTGGVDPETGDEIIKLLIEPVKNKKSSLIIATHGNLDIKIADKVYLLKNSRLFKQ